MPGSANLPLQIHKSVLLGVRHSRQAMDKNSHEVLASLCEAKLFNWQQEKPGPLPRALLSWIVRCVVEKSNHLKWF